jgi:hypothetical protein
VLYIGGTVGGKRIVNYKLKGMGEAPEAKQSTFSGGDARLHVRRIVRDNADDGDAAGGKEGDHFFNNALHIDGSQTVIIKFGVTSEAHKQRATTGGDHFHS